MTFETVIRGGRVVTSSDVFRADVAISDGRIVALGTDLSGTRQVDADGLLILPGGIDSHCHMDQVEPDGSTYEETFESGGRAALAGGTTSVVSFCPQHRGKPILPLLQDYFARAARAPVDHAFHQIITDPTEDVVMRELPLVVARGVRSFKVFLTYDDVHVSDRQYLHVLAAARRLGAMVTVHCENYDAIAWRTDALLVAGRTAPKYHAWSRPAIIEREATHRAIALAELVDQPVQVFHVSCDAAAEEIGRAQARGLKVWGETCPQYLVLGAADMDRPGFEGAKFICSPAPRDSAESERLWQRLRSGVLDVVSSDHSGWSVGGTRGKARFGTDAPFNRIANGVPGLAARLPLLFSEGVSKGRIDLPTFARLTAANPARIFGLAPRKGAIVPGADADLVLWDPMRRVRLTNALMQHAIDYTPYEGMEVTGWPVMTIRRGAVAMKDDVVLAPPGSGEYLPRAPYDLIRPTGILADGFDAAAVT